MLRILVVYLDGTEKSYEATYATTRDGKLVITLSRHDTLYIPLTSIKSYRITD